MNRMLRCLPGILFLLPALGQAAAWQALGPDGGAVSSLAVSAADADRVYAAGPNGLFRSDDRGQSWVDISAGLPVRFARVVGVSQTDANRLYIYNAGELYRTADAGEIWSPADPGVPAAAGFMRMIRVDPGDDQQLMAAFENGLYQSGDGGDTWQRADNGFFYSVDAFAVLPENPDIVLAAGRVDAESNHQAFRSDDGGETWSVIPVSGSTFGGAPQDFRVEFFPAGQAGRVMARSFGDVYLSDDSGQSWDPPEDAAINQLIVNTVWIDPGNHGVWYAGGQNGILYTADDGQTAVTASTGLGPDAAGGYMANVLDLVAAPDGQGLLAGTEHAGFWHGELIDGPAWTWERRNNGLRQVNIRSLAINPIHTSTVYAGYGDAFFSPSDLLWTTFNSGGNWSVTAGGMEATGLRALAVDPLTADNLVSTRLYAAGYGFFLNSLDQPQRPQNAGIFGSGNSGQDWATLGVNDVLGSRVLVKRALVLDPSSSAQRPDGGGEGLSTLYVAGSGWIDYSDPQAPQIDTHRIHKSTDFGDTWSPASNGLPIPPFDDQFGQSGSAYQQNIIALAIDPANPQTLYTGTFLSTQVDENGNPPELATPNGVFKSVDGGDNWVHKSVGLPRLDPDDASSPHWDVYALGVSASNPDTVYVVVQPVSRFTLFPGVRDSRVFRSNDGGENWSSASTGLPGDTDIRALLVDPEDPDTVYVAGQGTPSNPGAVYRTEDGGQSWNSDSVGLDVDSATALALDKSGELPVVYAGTRGGVYKVVQVPDEDADGVPDLTEEGAPNGGDGNNDGIPDELQSDVASLLSPEIGQRGANTYMTMEILGSTSRGTLPEGEGCERIWNAHSLTERNFPRDDKWTYPFGMKRFEIPDCSSIQLRIVFHEMAGESFDDTWQFRVFAPDEPGNIDTIRWQKLPESESDGNVWVINLADGELGDLRPQNGTIWVQGGAARIKEPEVFNDRFELESTP